VVSVYNVSVRQHGRGQSTTWKPSARRRRMQTEQAQHYLPQARLGGIKIVHVQLTQTKTSRHTICSVVQSSNLAIWSLETCLIILCLTDNNSSSNSRNSDPVRWRNRCGDSFQNEKARSMEPNREPGTNAPSGYWNRAPVGPAGEDHEAESHRVRLAW